MRRGVLASRCASSQIVEKPNKQFAALKDRAMVKGIAPIRVICFLFLAACGAVCQKPPPTDSQEMRTWSSLPDSPSSVQPPAQAQRWHPFVKESGTPGSVGVSAGVMRSTEPGRVTPGPEPGLTAHYQLAFVQEQSSTFLGKYLDPSS